MTADHDTAPGQAALTEDEREALVVALYESKIGEYGYLGRPECEQFVAPLIPAVERILAARATAPGTEASDALREAADASKGRVIGESWLRDRADSLEHGDE